MILSAKVVRGEGRQAGSHRSDSSSEPSEECLDDPTNVALSQRVPAHLPHRATLPPHGDPLLQASQCQRQQPKGSDAPLPVRDMPVKQGEWMKKQGTLLQIVCMSDCTTAADPNIYLRCRCTTSIAKCIFSDHTQFQTKCWPPF